jgi:hypothetical protein
MEVAAIMKSARSRRRILSFTAALGAACLLASAPVAAQAREGKFDRTLKVTGTVDLSVQTGSGSIQVVTGAGGAVRVAARLKADDWWGSGSDAEQRIRKIEQNPPIEQQGNLIRIGRFADEDLANHISISYELTVPADTKVTGHSGSGSITVGAVKGAVSANSGSGSIRVDGAASLDAHTGSGSIHASGIAGAVSANSGSGSITVSQTGSGEVSVSAASGSVSLSGINGPAKVSSASGGIEIEGRPAAPWTLHCSSGSVTLTLPPDAAFDLDARSSSGSISSAYPVTMTVTGTVDKHHIEGKVKGGGPLVKVSTSSGSVRIR